MNIEKYADSIHIEEQQEPISIEKRTFGIRLVQGEVQVALQGLFSAVEMQAINQVAQVMQSQENTRQNNIMEGAVADIHATKVARRQLQLTNQNVDQ
jgi:virulence-associated protein VapD